MPLNILPSIQTPDEQKSLCALLAHLLSASSYGFQHSVQQITQRLFRHIKAGYSFSKTEVNSLTTQLVEQNLLWKLPFGPHYKVTTDAVPFIIIKAVIRLADCNGLSTHDIASKMLDKVLE